MNQDDIVNEFEKYIDVENKNYSTRDVHENLYINSKDRNYKVDTNYNFSINFSNGGNNTLSYVNSNFKNIKKIQFDKLIISNIYVDIEEALFLYDRQIITNQKNIKLQRIADLPYLILNISEISSINYGTNKEFNKSSFILILDDNYDINNNNSGTYSVSGDGNGVENGNINNSIVSGTDKKKLKYCCAGNCYIDYFPLLKSTLKNMKISITTPSGKVLNNLTNYLSLDTIQNDTATDKKMVITFKQYFCCDEFNLGDTIVFKNVKLPLTSNIKVNELEAFLMRQEGHRIVDFARNGTVVANSKLYDKLYIPYDYTLDVNVSNNSTSEHTQINFGMDSNPIISFSSGECLNTSLQNLLAFKITSERRDNSELYTNVI